MKKEIKKFLIGIALGIANIIPGVSGGAIAMALDIYEELIHIASNIFKNFKKNVAFLFPILVGMAIAILLLSKVINYTLENYEFQTILFFVGLILGGVPFLLKKVSKTSINIKNIIIFLISFGLIFGLTFLNEETKVVDLSVIDINVMFNLFLVGIVAAATMVIPGISGSFILMMIGYYKPIVETISTLTDFSLFWHNAFVLGSFAFGILIGVILISKVIEKLLEKRPTETYYSIYGIVLASTLIILVDISVLPSFGGVLVGLVLFIAGYYSASKLV